MQVAEALGTEPPPSDAGLARLLEWEVGPLSALTPAALATTGSGGQPVAEVLRRTQREGRAAAEQVLALAGRAEV